MTDKWAGTFFILPCECPVGMSEFGTLCATNATVAEINDRKPDNVAILRQICSSISK